MKRLYVPKTLGIVLLSCLFVATAVVLFYLYKAYGAQNLFSPDKRFEKIVNLKAVSPTPAPKGKIASSRTTSGGKLTIIFFYDGYDTQNTALGYIEVFKKAIGLIEPFKSMPDSILYKTFTTDDSKCRVEADPKLLTCDKELIESFRKLGIDHFKVVLMSPSDFTSLAPISRGKNSYLTISTYQGALNPDAHKRYLGLEFTNLLGHSLGLSYEMTTPSATLKDPPNGVRRAESLSGKPNCAPDLATAKVWWGKYAGDTSETGFFKGCGEKDGSYFPEEHTLMSTDPQKESYGQVSADYLRGVLACFYGNEEKITYPAQKNKQVGLENCSEFKNQYPNFWIE